MTGGILKTPVSRGLCRKCNQKSIVRIFRGAVWTGSEIVSLVNISFASRLLGGNFQLSQSFLSSPQTLHGRAFARKPPARSLRPGPLRRQIPRRSPLRRRAMPATRPAPPGSTTSSRSRSASPNSFAKPPPRPPTRRPTPFATSSPSFTPAPPTPTTTTPCAKSAWAKTAPITASHPSCRPWPGSSNSWAGTNP